MGHTVIPDYYGTYSTNRINMGHTVIPDYYGTYSNTGLLWEIQ